MFSIFGKLSTKIFKYRFVRDKSAAYKTRTENLARNTVPLFQCKTESFQSLTPPETETNAFSGNGG
jgi:hypothetical protein